MNHRLKILTLLFFTTTLSQSSEVFVDTTSMNLAQISLSSQYCKNLKDNKKLCKKKALSYIDYADENLPLFLYGLKSHIISNVNAYHKEDLKSSTLKDIKEFAGDISGEWNNESGIELFAKTDKTYTLSTSSSGYTGGAHGYYGMTFVNYGIQSQMPLKLKDLFLPDSAATLMKIAKKHYKESRGLKPQESLTKDGWFSDKFVLAENFSITKRGLLFYYNAYEIKSYADRQTNFMLPYNKIRKLIKPKGPLQFALEKKRTTHVTFYEEEKASFDLEVKVNQDKTITLVATMQNLAYIPKGWFSLSFPQIDSRKQIISMKKQGFSKLNAYDKKSKVYHNTLNKSVKAKYLLVEAESKSWAQNKYSITLTLKAPKGSKEFIIDMRSNLKSKEKSLNIPEYEGVLGQQGFRNYRVFIGL